MSGKIIKVPQTLFLKISEPKSLKFHIELIGD